MAISPNAIIHADCLDLFERMHNKSVSLVYLDPLWIKSTHNQSDKEFNEYLEFLARTIQQSYRVLKDNGNLYFHLLPNLSNYIRIIIDQVFGRGNFMNEFILPRGKAGNGRVNHETVVLYGKSEKSIFNAPTKKVSPEKFDYRLKDKNGAFRLATLVSPVYRSSLVYEINGILPPVGKSWRYSKEKITELENNGYIYFTEDSKMPSLKKYADQDSLEIEIDNIWDDLMPRLKSKENLHYAQKPLAILERVIKSGSNEGDTILDPFCGSGTTLIAAQKLNRRWLGCDIDAKAINITIQRLKDSFKEEQILFTLINENKLKKNAPIAIGYSSLFTGMEYATRLIFELNKPVIIEETKYYEFKEITSKNPIDTIKNKADEYAVAFLNRDGGRIFWGIRDDRITIGVYLDQSQRDRVRKEVTNKLNEITPKISPTDYSIEFHNVTENGFPKENLYVVEVSVLKPRNIEFLFSTGGGETWIKTDSGKKKMSPVELQQEFLKRKSKMLTR